MRGTVLYRASSLPLWLEGPSALDDQECLLQVQRLMWLSPTDAYFLNLKMSTIFLIFSKLVVAILEYTSIFRNLARFGYLRGSVIFFQILFPVIYICCKNDILTFIKFILACQSSCTGIIPCKCSIALSIPRKRH